MDTLNSAALFQPLNLPCGTTLKNRHRQVGNVGFAG